MDAVLALTTIPDLVSQHKDESIMGLVQHSSKEDEEATRMLWFNNVGSGKQGNTGHASTVLASRAHCRLKQFCSTPTIQSPYDALVDEERLKALGLNPKYIGAFLKNINGKCTSMDDVRNTMYTASIDHFAAT